jgi:hypothetical protein
VRFAEPHCSARTSVVHGVSRRDGDWPRYQKSLMTPAIPQTRNGCAESMRCGLTGRSSRGSIDRWPNTWYSIRDRSVWPAETETTRQRRHFINGWMPFSSEEQIFDSRGQTSRWSRKNAMSETLRSAAMESERSRRSGSDMGVKARASSIFRSMNSSFGMPTLARLTGSESE